MLLLLLFLLLLLLLLFLLHKQPRDTRTNSNLLAGRCASPIPLLQPISFDVVNPNYTRGIEVIDLDLGKCRFFGHERVQIHITALVDIDDWAVVEFYYLVKTLSSYDARHSGRCFFRLGVFRLRALLDLLRPLHRRSSLHQPDPLQPPRLAAHPNTTNRFLAQLHQVTTSYARRSR